ncbi:MAG: hypothetical protein AAGL96_19190, partial [Pseudomonadota bacterium]
MLDGSTFFIRDVVDYVSFFEATSTGCPAKFFASHRPEFGLSSAFNIVIASHLDRQYWAERPIAMSESAGRQTLIPDVGNTSGRPAASTPD